MKNCAHRQGIVCPHCGQGFLPPDWAIAVGIVGCMFSGKTEEFIRRVRIAIKYLKATVLAFRPSLQAPRYIPGKISTSDKEMVIDAVEVQTANEILLYLDAFLMDEGISPHKTPVLVGIDEANLMRRRVRLGEQEEWEILLVLQALLERGCRVIFTGPEQNYWGEPYHPIPEMLVMCHPDHRVSLTAVCEICGGTATKSQLLFKSEPVLYGTDLSTLGRDDGIAEPGDYIKLAGKEGEAAAAGISVQARCSHCHIVPGRPNIESLLGVIPVQPSLPNIA